MVSFLGAEGNHIIYTIQSSVFSTFLPVLHVERFKAGTVLGNSVLDVKLEVETHLAVHGHFILTKGKPVLLTTGDVVVKVPGGVVRETGMTLLPAGTAPVELLGHELAALVFLLTVGTGEVHPEE